MPLLRPEPVRATSARAIDHTASAADAASRMLAGEVLRVTDRYSTGAEVLSALRERLPEPPHDAPHDRKRAALTRWRTASRRLLAPIQDHRLALAGGRPIPVLRDLYPELKSFHLPFAQIQELYGASQREARGLHLAVLGHKVHPFYGVYAPSRTEHLELFATWLKAYAGPRDRAVDVGTGCGVLALLLAKAGFARVLATDVNPNAIESVTRDLGRLSPRPPVDLRCGDLFAGDADPADVIVFNPPWTQGEADEPLDRALYFAPDLFPRFFDAAHARVRPEGRVVVVFSDVIRLVQPDLPHPIDVELEAGRFTLVNKLHRRVKTPPGSGRRTKERVEVWELQRT